MNDPSMHAQGTVVETASLNRFITKRSSYDLLINLCGCTVLLIIVCCSNQPPTYDEPHRLEVVSVLRRLGLTAEFLRQMPHATGPLTPVMQKALAPLTHLHPPGIRITNVVLLTAIIAMTATTLRNRGATKAWTNAIAVISLPTVWVISGLALTEIPAMACMAATVLALASLRENSNRTLTVMVAGIAAGGITLAALGRQPFVLVAAALPLAVWNRRERRLLFLVAALVSLIPIAVVCSVWGGMTPPLASGVATGVSPQNLCFAFGYACAFVLLFAPNWLRWPRQFEWLIVIGLVGNFVMGFIKLLPMSSVARRFVPPFMEEVVSRIAGSLLVALALWFLVSLAGHAWSHKRNDFSLLLCTATFLLLASTLWITGNFSSRYVAMVFPVLVPIIAEKRDPDSYFSLCRSLLGNILGLASLLSYLYGSTPK